jgi:3-hydroxybutyryl-CoA dehydrogenase
MPDANRSDLVLGVVGTGTMGRGIAQIAAAAGIETRLLDARPGAAGEARAGIAAAFDMLAGKDRMERGAAEAAKARLRPVDGEAALAGCHVVVEAIVEDLEAKRALFARLEPVVGPDCLLATNTSSLSVTAIASGCTRPERVAGFHFFNPVPLMKVVEVIDGALTDPAVGDALAALARRMGHRPVRAADTPGFVVNHAGRGFGTEALRILQDGVVSFDEIDRILRDLAGFRMGPFELLDLTGLDVSHPVMESIYGQFYHEPRFRPSYVLRGRLAAGLLGRKTGRGFYTYENGRQVPVPVPAVPLGERRPVWIAADEPGWRDDLAALVDGAGWRLDPGEMPAPGSLCLVAPLGRDATTTALDLGVDPERTVAIDLLFGLQARRVLMTTPATSAAFRDTAAALAAAGGTPVSVLRDSPGFVAQRTLATIVNVACEIAQQRIAAPDDIDDAVRLGLGYPRGPLAWGDAIGPRRLLRVLSALLDATGDPRYRPSLWLSRRARLGLSLLSPEG